jgi:5-methylcytosine-specific restriction endonuclease McrA
MFGKERIMQGHINHIRELFSQIEAESIVKEADSFERNYDALELPTLVAQIVDYLGGTNTMDNLVTACLHCNSSRGSRPAMDAIKKNNVDQTAASDANKPRR